jgi:endoglucanase
MPRWRASFAMLAVALAILAGLAVGAACVVSAGDRRTAHRRSDLLHRGVNLSGWFSQGPSDPGHLQSAITSDDVQRIRRMGFDHVRLPVDPAVLAPAGAWDAPDPDPLYYLDDAVSLLLDGGLSVIVDLHPDQRVGPRLAGDPATVERLARLWTILAQRLSARDQDRVYFELLNEPGVSTPDAWAPIQQRLAGAIRQGAPHHTIIATGHAWSAVEHLEALRPLDDGNIIYAFHFYEPHAFTHQGATWTAEPVDGLSQVPYPSSPTAVAPVLARTSDRAARDLLTAYAEQRWDAAAIERLVERAAAWRDRHGVPIICTELGVYRPASPPDDRVAWLRDVRTALERRRIAWTAWEYAGGFGIVDGPAGRRVIHAPTARALLGE